nr:penicillin-binding protein [Lentibacillus saliphilus]
MKHKHTHVMSGIFILIFAFVFMLIGGRFLYIQASGTVNDVSLSEWAQKIRTASYPLSAERGKILDHNGLTLAYDHPTFTIYATVDEAYTVNEKEPKHVVDVETTAEKLAPFLDVEKSYIVERIQWGIDNEKTQVEFGSNGKQLSQQTKKDIEALSLPGIGFTKQAIRNYPNGMFASRIIGFAQKDESGDIKGITGMEKQMEDLLKGEAGHISYERDRYGAKLLDPNEVIQKPQDGQDVYLTLDQKIQILLEDSMSQVDETYEPERMTAIVMNPKTGEILAMSNRPSFNPNNPDQIENWYNDAISTPIEPGSTLKMVTWAAAIESGNYNGADTFKSGTYKVSDLIDTVHDHNAGKGWGTISFDEGFERSSNVAASKLVWENMGPDIFLDYLHAFDLDKKTNIDLPGEVAGKIVYRWPYEKLTAAFGQGSTYTPMQIMKAATAIANDGQMMTPYVISKIVNPATGDVVQQNEPKKAGQPISKETAQQVMGLLENVVSGDHGTGKSFALKGYSVAGKTGTAQIANPDGPGHLYGRENHIFSFLGMAPKDDPSLMMFVMVKQPKLEPHEYGSLPVSFIFKNVMENSLHYLDIEPDKETGNEISAVEMPELVDQSVERARQIITDKGLEAVFVGNGKTVKGVNITKGTLVMPGQRLILLTDIPEMPDIIGWSKRDVLQLAELMELEVEIKGNGYVHKQSVSEGDQIDQNTRLVAEFAEPEKPATEIEETDAPDATNEASQNELDEEAS